MIDWPKTAPENPAAREVKNKLCIDGHLNEALDAVMRSTSPDETFALLSELAHKAVDAAFAVRANPDGKTVDTLALAPDSFSYERYGVEPSGAVAGASLGPQALQWDVWSGPGVPDVGLIEPCSELTPQQKHFADMNRRITNQRQEIRNLRRDKMRLYRVLSYWHRECSGAEPSLSVFNRMVDEALSSDSALMTGPQGGSGSEGQ